MSTREDDFASSLEPTDSGVPGIDITSQQMMTIRLLVNGGMKYSEICRRANVSPLMFKKWLKEANFRRALIVYKERMDKVDSSYRRKQLQQVMPAVYDEIIERAQNGSLKRLKTGTLVDIMSKLGHEIRIEEDRSSDDGGPVKGGEFEELLVRFRRRKEVMPDIAKMKVIDITPTEVEDDGS